MKVHGQRVYLNMPVLPESKIELSPELKREMQQEIASKFDRLTVFAVSDGIESIKVGDEVYVDPSAVRRAVNSIVKIDDSEKLIVSVFDIMHTW